MFLNFCPGCLQIQRLVAGSFAISSSADRSFVDLFLCPYRGLEVGVSESAAMTLAAAS
jgi:hypothetical protein